MQSFRRPHVQQLLQEIHQHNGHDAKEEISSKYSTVVLLLVHAKPQSTPYGVLRCLEQVTVLAVGPGRHTPSPSVNLLSGMTKVNLIPSSTWKEGGRHDDRAWYS